MALEDEEYDPFAAEMIRNSIANNFETITNNNNNNNNRSNGRYKNIKYPNDAGLTDAQMELIYESRKYETKKMINNYIDDRKRNYPTKKNVELKKKIINIKKGKRQLLTNNEKILNFEMQTGYKQTPNKLRFNVDNKSDNNLIRKVLSKEINNEYSAILQCFRYFVKNDFFLNQ
mmetsp:Transcript_68534/g.84060  ORF Transcript_68534/g.84060 Transcript_68534/m.84060 type:complete len:174 (+) Transcript_68534:21-542(+)